MFKVNKEFCNSFQTNVFFIYKPASYFEHFACYFKSMTRFLHDGKILMLSGLAFLKILKNAAEQYIILNRFVDFNEIFVESLQIDFIKHYNKIIEVRRKKHLFQIIVHC